MGKIFKRERRRFLRVGTYHLSRYLRYDSKGNSYPILGISRNIGGGGLMLLTEEELKIGDKIGIEVNFPPFESPLKAIAQVIYRKKKERSNKWQVGVKFIDLGDPALDQILDYVDYIDKTAKKYRRA